ncbi:hypothetical protein [Sulfitobacter sp.]|uniref:hypothetical protein n=1 Tax=Sulfitobacter sp. TaxID=1903071 RepID=UPI00300182D4
MKPTFQHQEARVFSVNAARGVRDVGMAWLLRKFFVPLFLFLVCVVVAAYAANGILAAVPASVALVAYLVWITGIYRRNFLKGAPFLRNRQGLINTESAK